MLLRKFPWGFRLGAQLPVAFVYLKQKKSFKKARSIISYKQSLMAPVLKVAALVLSEVTKDVFPDTFGRLNLSTLWPNLHRFIEDVVAPLRETKEFQVVCDDLVGFFNSLPIDRILKAVELVFLTYFARRPSPDPDKFIFTVHDKQKFSEGRVLRGKPRLSRSAIMRQMSAGDEGNCEAVLKIGKVHHSGKVLQTMPGLPHWESDVAGSMRSNRQCRGGHVDQRMSDHDGLPQVVTLVWSLR